jgi:hypothetical protein
MVPSGDKELLRFLHWTSFTSKCSVETQATHYLHDCNSLIYVFVKLPKHKATL